VLGIHDVPIPVPQPAIAGFLEWLVRSALRQNITAFIAKVSLDDLTAISQLIVSGKVAPMTDKVYSLREAADAIAYVETCHARAKVVISKNTS
jgi:NADPH:quinone reductase-like Zn-dependent oxidoreductase